MTNLSEAEIQVLASLHKAEVENTPAEIAARLGISADLSTTIVMA